MIKRGRTSVGICVLAVACVSWPWLIRGRDSSRPDVRALSPEHQELTGSAGSAEWKYLVTNTSSAVMTVKFPRLSCGCLGVEPRSAILQPTASQEFTIKTTRPSVGDTWNGYVILSASSATDQSERALTFSAKTLAGDSFRIDPTIVWIPSEDWCVKTVLESRLRIILTAEANRDLDLHWHESLEIVTDVPDVRGSIEDIRSADFGEFHAQLLLLVPPEARVGDYLVIDVSVSPLNCKPARVRLNRSPY